MREIGTISNRNLANRFINFIRAKGIQGEIRVGDSDECEIWILCEKDITQSKSLWKQFKNKPNNPVYVKEAEKGERIKHTETKETEKLIKKTKRLKRKINREMYASYITIGLIIASSLLYLFKAHFQAQIWGLLSFSQYQGNTFFPEILSGQIWRLFTPMLLHASFFHLLFNMMWLFQLGQMIEKDKGSLYILLTILLISGLANTAQYLVSGGNFLGMSGVVYGLFGFIWVKTRLELNHNYLLSSFTVGFLLIYYLLCVIGVFGHIANTNHGVGLCAGMIGGFFSTDYLKDLKKIKRLGLREIAMALSPFALALIGIISDV